MQHRLLGKTPQYLCQWIGVPVPLSSFLPLALACGSPMWDFTGVLQSLDFEPLYTRKYGGAHGHLA